MDKKIYALTNPQRSIWFTEQFYSNSNINNIVGYLKINEKTDFKALERAFNYFVMRNESFKTKITLVDSTPMQFFDDFVYDNLEIIDLKDESQLLEFEASFPMQTINVLGGFLFNAKLLRFPDETGIFVITAHHLIADAWTMTILLEEIHQNYLDIISKKDINLTPNPSYVEFINAQSKYMNSSRFEKDVIFWQDKFDILPSIISFKNNTQTSINADRMIYSFDKSLAKKIKTFCKKHNISDYIFLFSIFNIYFKNIFNCDNFIIGNPILNRSNFREKNMTGMFVSIMPFVVDFPSDCSFLKLCQHTSTEQKQMYRHIHYPYHEILNFIRKKHDFSDSLYDIVFSYQNATIPSYCKWLHNRSQAESLQIHVKNLDKDNDDLSIHYDFLTDIFASEDISLMHKRILGLIEQALDNPDVNINSLEIISPSEKKLILKNFNNTKEKYNKSSNIAREFEKTVKLYPDNVAVVDQNESYSYKTLNDKANFLAKKILEITTSSDTITSNATEVNDIATNVTNSPNIIAFALDRSCAIAVSILAILKSGYTYMPIDPEYPSDRIDYMLKNSEVKVLITNKTFDKIHNFEGTCIYYEDLTFDETHTNINLPISSSNLCYIMYTSGSTGTPKAVSIKHYNVLNFVKSMQKRLDYAPSASNKVVSLTTVCFDIFVFELFSTLLSGLTLVIADTSESRSPKLLCDLIYKHKISKIITTPSRVELMLTYKNALNSLASVKEFIMGGEPLPSTLLKKLKMNTKAKIFNLYGPTETTVYSSFKDMSDSDFVTIGKPIDNTKIYVLNDNLKLQPFGLTGEIFIGGDGVGAGYYKDKEKTDKAFIENPYNEGIIYKTGDLGYFQANGELVCLRRKDHQVKIRGYRIELDDISNNILTYPNIENCVVIDKIDKKGKKYLCAYLVCKEEVDISDLKKYLVDILPHYMIPNYFVVIDSIPLTFNHKVDRKNLPDPNFKKDILLDKYVKPTTKIEKDLCNIFKTCLSIKKIGTENDIFDFNIDSLDIITVQTKMLEYNYKLNTQDFYKYRTIKKIADFIENKDAVKAKVEDTTYLSNVNYSFYKHPNTMKFSKKYYKNILLLGCTRIPRNSPITRISRVKR